MQVITKAIVSGIIIVFAGTIPRNLVFWANTQYLTAVPWAVPVVGLYLWFFFRYLNGWGDPQITSASRKEQLRANKLTATQWFWALLAGGIGIVAIVILLRLLNRMILLPEQHLPDFSRVPRSTLYSLLLAAAPIAGVIEESAFRGYMQKPIERKYGLLVAIFITGTMFALVHLDFTLVLWPYYIVVAAVYGTVTWLCDSILPAIVLHTAGNIYSNLDLLSTGRAEWQAPVGTNGLIWTTGADLSFWIFSGLFILLSIIFIVACRKLKSFSRSGHATRVY